MYCMSLLLLSTHFMAVSPALATTPIAISFAEQPVRLLRDKDFYLAGRGAQLQNGDIVATGSGAIQIDGAGSSTVALGPASLLHLRIGSKGAEYLLLGGWLKFQARATGDHLLSAVRSAGMRVDPAASSFILHASPGKTELFVESGQPGVDQLRTGKPARRVAVAREQYAVLGPGQALKVMPRAPREFLGAIPPAFVDALVPVAARASVTATRLERRASFAEVAPWLGQQIELRQAIQRRFHPPKKAPPRPTPAIAKDPS